MKEAREKKPQVVGRVTHYFDQAKVAVIECTKGSIKTGDEVIFRHGDHELRQMVSSMQIDHQNVDAIKKGDEAGVLVDEPVKEGYEVVKA